MPRVASYRLAMAFDPPARRFTGTVTLDAEVDGGTLVLNAADLAVGAASVDGQAVRPEADAARQELRVPVAAPGRHEVVLDFSGTVMPDGLAGMYVSKFGRGQEILTTQMYPAGARRFFPCVDLPSVKAEIRAELDVPRTAHVVFNTDPEGETVEGDRRRIRFRPTPRMSTYLLYVGIGPFEETERSDGGLRVIVAHPPGRSADTAFALDHAARFLRAYEAYYDIPYPLPKLHLVAVPSFWAGAMENWGAIAFRETALLVEPTTDTLARRYIRLVLAHEIAHQWFGNLVTNAWWSDFWLNEAFATFVSHRIVDRVHPGEAIWEDFFARETARGLAEDALDCTHPIEVDIHGPEEVGQIADQITYGKGATVLRMIESYLTEETFRRGVAAYLAKHAYGAASGADLWAALDAASGQPVSRVLGAWITRPGHPLVELRRDGGELVVTQRRFRADGRPDASKWPVPLVLDIDGRTVRTLLEEAPYRCPLPAGARWRANPDRAGFYRIRYVGDLGRELGERWSELSELDRAGMLGDAFAFLTSGDATLAEFLALVDRATTDPSYLPALTAARQLRALEDLRGADARLAAAYERFFRTQMARVGPRRAPGEPEAVGGLRATLALGRLPIDAAFRRELSGAYAAGDGTLDPDLLDAASAAWLWEGGAAAWETAHARMLSPGSDEEALRLATALPYAPGSAELGRTLELLEGSELSPSRVWDVLRAANAVPRHAAALWAWYAERLPALAERWRGTPLLALLLPESLPRLGLGRGDAVRAYFGAHPFPDADRGVVEGLERLRLRELLAERLGPGARS